MKHIPQFELIVNGRDFFTAYIGESRIRIGIIGGNNLETNLSSDIGKKILECETEGQVEDLIDNLIEHSFFPI